MPTSIDRNSKPDTVFLCLPAGGGATALVTDVSQNRTALTNNTTYVSEANSARTALSSPRELTIVVEIASGQSGVLVYHGNAGGYGYRVRINAGAVEVAENAILLLSVALPGLAVGAQEYAILWSQHDDGAQVRSELAVVNTATGAWAHAQGTHAGFAPSAADSFIIGAAWGGATAFSGGLGAFNAVRVGGRHHSGAEHAEDWLAERTPPTVTQTRRDAPIVPDRATLDVASDGSFCGPAHLWAGWAFEQADRRLHGPVVNVRTIAPALEVGSSYDTYSTAWWKGAPGAALYKTGIAHLHYRPAPLKANRLHVRAFVYQYSTNPNIAEVYYRAYSMADLPTVGEPVKPTRWRSTAIASCPNDHASGGTTGEWIDLGPVEVQVDDWGCTWIALAIRIDEGSPDASATYTSVLALTAEPYHEPAGDGGLDIVLP